LARWETASCWRRTRFSATRLARLRTRTDARAPIIKASRKAVTAAIASIEASVQQSFGTVCVESRLVVR
jgi:hypothetical protein